MTKVMNGHCSSVLYFMNSRYGICDTTITYDDALLVDLVSPLNATVGALVRGGGGSACWLLVRLAVSVLIALTTCFDCCCYQMYGFAKPYSRCWTVGCFVARCRRVCHVAAALSLWGAAREIHPHFGSPTERTVLWRPGRHSILDFLPTPHPPFLLHTLPPITLT